MCGIVGYIGKKEAAPILINGLSKLEYRGYDSAGIAVVSNGVTNVIKTKGRSKVCLSHKNLILKFLSAIIKSELLKFMISDY